MIRLKFFKDKFKQLVETSPSARKRLVDFEALQEVKADQRKLFQFLHPNNLIVRSMTRKSTKDGKDGSSESSRQPGTPPPSGTGTPKKRKGKLRPHMIRKVDNHIEMQEAINRLAAERRREEAEAASDREQAETEKSVESSMGSRTDSMGQQQNQASG